MARDPRQHVLPGQPLRLAAEQVNALNRLSRVSGSMSGNALPDGYSAPYTWVYAKNATSGEVSRWGVMSIAGLDVTPTNTITDAASVQYQTMPILSGGTPSADTRAWCIALEPIAAGEIGRVAIAGVVQCRIDVKAEADTIAGPKASTAELESGRAGAEILWKQPGLGTNKWALVRIDSGNGSARFGEVTAAWNKGAVATVTWLYPDGSDRPDSPTFQALNQFESLPTPSPGPSRFVLCVLDGNTWLLAAWEPDSCENGSSLARSLSPSASDSSDDSEIDEGSGPQVLINSNGCVKWVRLREEAFFYDAEIAEDKLKFKTQPAYVLRIDKEGEDVEIETLECPEP